MIGHEVFILSYNCSVSVFMLMLEEIRNMASGGYNCSMSIFMLHLLSEVFSARFAFFPNYFYIEKSGSSYGLIKKEEFSVSAVYDIPCDVPMV